MRHVKKAMSVLIVLAAPGLAIGCSAPPTEPGAEVSAAEVEVERYLATWTEPCGRSLLEIRSSEEDAPLMVQSVGENGPIGMLRWDMLVRGRWVVHGRLHRDALIDDGHCGAYPRFEIESFEPLGPVQRCSPVGAIMPVRYTEHLPKNAYVPEDFKKGPPGRLLDDDCETIAQGGRCESPRVRQLGCDYETWWCCGVAPEE